MEVPAWVKQMTTIMNDGRNEMYIQKIIWYAIGVVLIISLQFILPIRAVFSNPASNFIPATTVIDVISQIYFIIDLIVQWNIYKNQQAHIPNSQPRFRVIEYIITVPWALFGFIFSAKMYYYLRLADLLRIVRLKYYWNGMRSNLVHYTGSIFSIHTGLCAVMYHMLILFLIASYTACAWYILGDIESSFYESWIDLSGKPVFAGTKTRFTPSNYLLSMYWAMVSMSSVGYGGIIIHISSFDLFLLIPLIDRSETWNLGRNYFCFGSSLHFSSILCAIHG